MLLKCPECGLQVSDKAYTCPHCGYPMVPTKQRKPYGQHRRLPNGFGRITKISNQNLRNPYRAMVTIGKTSEGRPISRILKPKGYFRTYNEAYAALVEYNKNPYDLSEDITLKELYEKWSKQHFEKYPTKSTRMAVELAWKYCTEIENIKVRDLRIRHIRYCIEEAEYCGSPAPASVKPKIKSIFVGMLDFAVEYELTDRNLAKNISIHDKKPASKHHMSFTEDEMSLLWNSLDVPYVDVVLIQCYTGMRPQELGLIEISNVDLDNSCIIGGMKTDAGRNRVIPIHPKIRVLVEMRYRNAQHLNSKYLFNCVDSGAKSDDIRMTYSKYRKRFVRIVEQLHLDQRHKPHDGRKTFVTMAKKAKLDEYAIKYIVGHAINDITEEVYTDRQVDWLLEEIKKIK